MAFYFDHYTWAKYGKIILPSTIFLEERAKTLLHSTFWKSFQQFLCIDLDGNLSSSPSTRVKQRLGKYVSTLFKGQSETATQTEMFAAWVNEPQHKEDFIKQITKIALSATIIYLSIFTQFFHWRFSKHTYLETSLEMLQQAYIVKETESKAFYLIPGDTCLYTLKCSCCQKGISSPGLIGATLYHASIAIVRHWGFFDIDKPPGESDLSSMPMLFSSMDTFQWALGSFEDSLDDKDGNFGGWCVGSVGYQTHVEAFGKAVKVDIARQWQVW
jgi:hypothetical protein